MSDREDWPEPGDDPRKLADKVMRMIFKAALRGIKKGYKRGLCDGFAAGFLVAAAIHFVHEALR